MNATQQKSKEQQKKTERRTFQILYFGHSNVIVQHKWCRTVNHLYSAHLARQKVIRQAWKCKKGRETGRRGRGIRFAIATITFYIMLRNKRTFKQKHGHQSWSRASERKNVQRNTFSDSTISSLKYLPYTLWPPFPVPAWHKTRKKGGRPK